jgi:hypothetical protein
MRIMVAALIALTVAIVLLAPASAAIDPEQFWEQQNRNLP